MGYAAHVIGLVSVAMLVSDVLRVTVYDGSLPLNAALMVGAAIGGLWPRYKD